MGVSTNCTLTDRTLGRTVFVARCDIPWAPMLKHPSGQCHLKKGIGTSLKISFSLYRVLKYYSNVEYPPNRPHAKNQFLRAVGVIFSTDRTHFRDRTQKLTRQLEVEGHTFQTPSKNSVRSVSVRSENRPVYTV